MTKRTVIAHAGFFGLILLAPLASADQIWEVKNGTTSMTLYRQIIRDIGLQLEVRETAVPRTDMEEAVGFKVTRASDLKFFTKNGMYRYWTEGRVTSAGGFTLKSDKGSLAVDDFAIVYRNTGESDNMFVLSGASESSPVAFDLSHIKVNFDRKTNTLRFGYADMILTNKAAARLGRPDLAGQIIGMATVSAQAAFVSGDKVDPYLESNGADGDLNGNIKLHLLGECASFGRVGTFPNGISGLGIATTSCNVTDIEDDVVDWYQQMDERHPVIAQNFYRIRSINGGTRFEQIGDSWVKHGFLSTNSNGCVGPNGETCQTPPGGGSELGVFCSDTYGSGLNASRDWLGPRDEINAFAGTWECTGSYFSNYQNDCVERFDPNGLGPVDHRLQVHDQDLTAPNSQFFYEAYYVSRDDVDRYNSAAFRPCTVNFQGGDWHFQPTQSQTNGVVADHWGDIQPAPRAQPTTEGDILVAVQVNDLGGGKWHYEYAVYNHTSYREMRQFTIPLPDGLTLENVEFRDIDKDNTDEWTWNYANSALTWKTSTYAQNPDANSLKWNSVFNFRFDANSPPAVNRTTATLGLFRPGVLQMLAAETRGPKSPFTNPTILNVERGDQVAGGLADLFNSDDSKMGLHPGIVFGTFQAPIRVVLESTSAQGPITLKFRVESAASSLSVSQKIELYNFTLGRYVSLSTTNLTTSDGVVEVTAPNPSQFVQAVTGKVRARLEYRVTGPVFVFPWRVDIDQAVWRILP
ncbi:MAG: hypothetical protein ACR2HJ_03065 [Fimbriimonadales bacterium]